MKMHTGHAKEGNNTVCKRQTQPNELHPAAPLPFVEGDAVESEYKAESEAVTQNKEAQPAPVQKVREKATEKEKEKKEREDAKELDKLEKAKAKEIERMNIVNQAKEVQQAEENARYDLIDDMIKKKQKPPTSVLGAMPQGLLLPLVQLQFDNALATTVSLLPSPPTAEIVEPNNSSTLHPLVNPSPVEHSQHTNVLPTVNNSST